MSDDQQPKRGRGRPKKESTLTETAEELALFYHWRDVLMPKLHAMNKKGIKPDDLLAEFSSDAAVRMLTIALSSPDQKVALSALQDVLDRSQGRATQKTIVEGKFDRLPDEEINALLFEATKAADKPKTDEH